MKPFFGGVGEEALKSSLPQRGRRTTVGFPKASEVELWGFSLVVDEEDEFHTNYI